MPPEELNVNPQEEMSPDESAAMLAFATNLSQQMMPKAQEKPKTAPKTTKEKKSVQDTTKEENALRSEVKGIKKEIEEIKEMLQTDEKSEIEAMKNQIQDILKEDGIDES